MSEKDGVVVIFEMIGERQAALLLVLVDHGVNVGLIEI